MARPKIHMTFYWWRVLWLCPAWAIIHAFKEKTITLRTNTQQNSHVLWVNRMSMFIEFHTMYIDERRCQDPRMLPLENRILLPILICYLNLFLHRMPNLDIIFPPLAYQDTLRKEKSSCSFWNSGAPFVYGAPLQRQKCIRTLDFKSRDYVGFLSVEGTTSSITFEISYPLLVCNRKSKILAYRKSWLDISKEATIQQVISSRN